MSTLAWRKANPAKQRRIRLRASLKTIGLTLEDYDQKLSDQNYICPVCDKPLDMLTLGKKNTMHADHCHKTGIFRGVLHGRCNILLGQARDDAVLLQQAIDYLNKHN